AEETFARVCYAAEDDYDLGVEDVHHVGDARAEELGGVAHDLLGQLVAVVRGLIDGLGRDLLQRAVQVVGQPAGLARLDGLHRPPGDGRPRGIGLEAAVAGAPATGNADLAP